MVTESTKRELRQMVSARDKCYQSVSGSICNHKPAHAPPRPSKETRVRTGETSEEKAVREAKENNSDGKQQKRGKDPDTRKEQRTRRQAEEYGCECVQKCARLMSRETHKTLFGKKSAVG